ncbi:aldo/keto reductase [Streptomyces sp. MP131-18]|uniref:aldo/keto reductase n=1 Tax=Streptomyces sp. MP131-18 TaxID=1857892 RepID=UPI00097BA885|nr:aldo/keto reductase [Streptomyces sp. MP131-18]ONK14209.1 General stress protein 69 [Streptomyces sp. MP131-18]
MIYRLLGRTGLRVSPLALGTMTFGQDGWGTDEETARVIFRHYLESGGNFVDTANGYADGRSEELLGTFIKEAGCRERIVLATKFTGPTEPGNPNATGNGRKNLLNSLDASLRRLRTDYLDLYWMHLWDTVTPVEEVMATFDAVVRSGKVRAVGLSDVPAWYLTKAQLLAAGRGWEPVAALQLEYSLVERHIEREHVPAAADLGMGIVPWSPLASGFLSGKYTRSDGTDASGQGRLESIAGAPFMRGRTERDWQVLDTLIRVAAEVDRSPAQVAINWVARRPGVVSTLIGARDLAQLTANLAALDVELTAGQVARLEAAGRPESYTPYILFDPDVVSALATPGFQVRPF